MLGDANMDKEVLVVDMLQYNGSVIRIKILVVWFLLSHWEHVGPEV